MQKFQTFCAKLITVVLLVGLICAVLLVVGGILALLIRFFAGCLV